LEPPDLEACKEKRAREVPLEKGEWLDLQVPQEKAQALMQQP